MKAMIHKLSKAQKSVIASFLALVMVFGVFASIAPVEAQAVELNATSTGFGGGVAYSGKDGETSFVNGAAIKVVNTKRTSKNEATYTTTDGTNWITDDAFVWNSSSWNQFQAYYPVADYASFDSFTIPADQSTESKLALADWMTVETEDIDKPENGVLNLNFQHRLTKVTVKITNWTNEYDGAEKVVSEPYIHSKGLELDAAYGDTVEITAGDNGGSVLAAATADYEYTAIVMPAAYESTDTFFTFTVDGTPLTVSVGSNTTLTEGLKAGKHYTFELTVGKEAVTLSEVTVEGWKEENIDGGVAEEVVSDLTDEMVYLAEESFQYTGNAITPEVTVTDGETALTKDTDFTVEYSNNIEAGTATITVTGKGRWTGTVTKQFTISQ